MAFSSVQFLFVFLPLALAVYYVLPKAARNAVLCLFSLILFGWSGLRGAALLLGVAALNWLGGLALARTARKRGLLALLVAADLGGLCLFKYAGFAAESVNRLFPGLLPVLAPVLPLGISFYLFAAIGYCADVAAGRVQACRSPVRFFVFLAFLATGRRGPSCGTASRPPSWTPGPRAAASRPSAFATASNGFCSALPKRCCWPTSWR